MKSRNIITYGLGKKSGRNHHGRITVRGRGGGFRLLFRNIDYYRNNFFFVYTVQGFFYDSKKKATVAVIINKNSCHFILKPVGLFQGSRVACFHGLQDSFFFKVGCSYILGQLPVGCLVHNVSKKPQAAGIISRAAGTFCQIIFKNDQKVILKLPSKKLASFSIFCRATYGVIDFVEHSANFKKNAGGSRKYGFRPKTRGVAINPVDHPHGGGEGKGSVARKQSVTPWGRSAKGKKR